MTVTCQECGQKLDNWNVKHNVYDCGKYHLERAIYIMNSLRESHDLLLQHAYEESQKRGVEK